MFSVCFRRGLRGGAVVVIVEANDEPARQVRRLFDAHGGRTGHD